jgi:pyruvate dehydrogenase (quinone)
MSRKSISRARIKMSPGAFVQQASVAPQVRHLVDRAIRIARGERRVTAIIIPNDLQEEPYVEPHPVARLVKCFVSWTLYQDGQSIVQ